MEESLTVQLEIVTTQEEQPQADEPNPVTCSKHRKLLLVLLAASLVTVALGLGLYSHQQKTLDFLALKWKSAAPPCLSSECLRTSKHFSVSMDPFSHPCDYFLWTCGRGDSSRGREAGKNDDSDEQDKKRAARRGGPLRMRKETDDQGKSDGQLNRFPDRQTALLKAIKEILEAPDEGVSMATAEMKVKRFFKTCMDSESPEKVGSEPFLTLLQQLGGWAVSGDWKQADFNTTLALLMGQYSTFPFFSVYVGPDSSDGQTASNQHYIQIDQPHFQFPIDWNSKTQKSKAVTQFLRPFYSSCAQYLVLLGVPDTDTTQHCGLYVSLSTTLALATSPLSYRLSQRLLYHRITIQQLQILAPAIDWLSCLQAIFQPLTFSQSDVVLVHNLPYIRHMSQTIENWQVQHELMGTNPLHTYMIFSLLQTLIPALDSRFTQTMRNFFIATGDTEGDIPRWKRCVQQTEQGFDTLLSHMIREKHAQNEAEKLAEELVDDVYSSLKMKIETLSWADRNSSSIILNKIKSLTPRLSIETDELSHLELNQLYAEVVITEEYFSSYLQLLVLEQKRRRRMLSHAAQNEGLSISPYISGNDIIIPVGMFVYPFFHSSYPRALNYGTLGFLMAKDLLHLLIPDIHTQATNPELESMCVWSHYLSVTRGPSRVGALPLSPSKQQEVWVQYAALQVALDAYKISFKRHPEDSSLSGLSYVHLFLSSFTKVTCDADSYREHMPFEPSFLVTVLCSNSNICPKPLTCLNKSQSYPSEMCQS